MTLSRLLVAAGLVTVLLAATLWLVLGRQPVGSHRSPAPSARPDATAHNPPPTPASSAASRTGINVEPSMRPSRYLGANPDGWWDPAAGTGFIDSEMPLIQSLGSPSLRLEFPWYLMEPVASGAYDWSRSDYIVSSATAHHVELQPIVAFTPRWAAARPNSPPAAADFSSFMTALVNRYRSSIHLWELWNEPDHIDYWSGNEQQYVTSVLIPGHEAVRAADPSARVILGGPSNPNLSWLNAIYDLGGGEAFEIMAFHDYSSGDVIKKHALAVQGVLDAHGQSSKPIWLGEYGQQEDTLKDIGQQALMHSVLTGGGPIAMAQWYNLRDDSSMSCCPPAVVKEGHWGLVRHDLTRKAGFETMRSLMANRA